jgi:hypothetical protein
VVSQ